MKALVRILPFLFLLLPHITKAGSCDSLAFYKTIASSGGMTGSVQMMSNAPSGNFYVLTNITGPGNFGNGVTANQSGMFLVKYTSGGQTCWAKQISPNSMNSVRMALDSRENIYFSMHYNGTTSLLATTITSTSSTYDIFVAKVDSASNALWVKSYGGSDADLFFDIAISGTSVRITGKSNSNLSFGSCTLTGNYDYTFIAEFDTAGTCQSAFNMKSSSASQVRLKHDASGNIFLSLRCVSLEVGGGTQSVGYNVGMMLKFSPAYTLQWLWILKSSSNSYFIGLEIDEQGNSYGLCYFNGSSPALVSLNGQQQISLNTTQKKIIKINSQGSFCWERDLWCDNEGATHYRSGRIRLAGRFANVYDGGYTGSFQGIGYQELDTSGMPVFIHAAYTTSNAIPNHIFTTSSGRVVLGIQTSSNTYLEFRNTGQSISSNLYSIWAFDRNAQSPVPQVPSDSTIACGANVQLSIPYHTGKSYNWFPVTDIVSPYTNYPDFRTKESRTYSLRSYEKGCSVDSSSFVITVNPLQITARTDTSVFCGEVVKVSATINAVSNYTIAWNPVIGNGLSFNHTLTTDKTVTVRLSATGCTSAYDTVNLTLTPITKFLKGDTSAYCSELIYPGLPGFPQTYYYSGPSGISYGAPTLRVGTQTTYPFSMTKSGCQTVYDTIKVTTLNYTTVEIDTSVICGSTVSLGSTLRVFPGDNYHWENELGGFLSGGAIYNNTAYTSMHLARESSQPGCTTRVDSVRVHVLPYEVSLPEVVSLFCADTATVNIIGPTGPQHSYSWAGPAGQLFNGNTLARVFPKTDTWYVLKVQNWQCGSDQDSMFVDVKDLPLNANAGPDKSMPCDANVELSGSGTGSPYLKYNWTPSLGLSNPNIANPVAKPIINTTYKLAVYVPGCNSDTDEVHITVLNPNPPDPGITTSTGEFNMCNGGITLSGADGFQTYKWSTGSSNKSITVQKSGVYTLQVIEASGCGNEQTVEIKPLFDLVLPDGHFICTNQTNFSVRLQGPSGMDSYNWNNGSQVQNISVSDAGVYLLTANKGTCHYTDTAIIQNHPGFAVADFTYSRNGAVFDFTTLTSSPKFFAWDFGDGNTSTERNPTHAYAQVGTYDVCLELTDVCGSTDDICKTVTVSSMVGMEDPAEIVFTEVYPNPSGGTVTIKGRGLNPAHIKLYSVQGQEIAVHLSGNEEETVLHTTAAPGVYLLRIENQSIKIIIH